MLSCHLAGTVVGKHCGMPGPEQLTEWVTQGLCKERGQWGAGRKCEMTGANGWASGKGRWGLLVCQQ